MDPRNPAAAALRAKRRTAAGTITINKAAADHQLTADQLIFESFDLHRREYATGPDRPELLLSTVAELEAYRGSKRKEFELLIRRDTSVLANWSRYAGWEILQGDVRRVRSVFERAAQFHSASPSLWCQYCDFECGIGAVNHARNVMVRAVATLPAEESVWLRFLALELTIRNLSACRTLFREWLRHRPPFHVLRLFVHFECDHGDAESIRDALKALLETHPGEFASWSLFAAVEHDILGCPDQAEAAFRTALTVLPRANGLQMIAICDVHTALARILHHQPAAGRDDAAAAELALASEALSIAASMSTSTPDVTSMVESRTSLVLAMKDDLTRTESSFDHFLRDMYDRRRRAHQQALDLNPGLIDTWVALLQLEQERRASPQKVAVVYEAACFSWSPASGTHPSWEALTRLWISYALHLIQTNTKSGQTDDNGDDDGLVGLPAAIDVLNRAIDTILELQVTAKTAFTVFIQLAELEIRAGSSHRYRDAMDRGIAYLMEQSKMAAAANKSNPTPAVLATPEASSASAYEGLRRLFRRYIDLEKAFLEAGLLATEFPDRQDPADAVRSIFFRMLAPDCPLSTDGNAWIEFMDFEASMWHSDGGDQQRRVEDRIEAVFQEAIARRDASSVVRNRDALWVRRIAIFLRARDPSGARKLFDSLLTDALEGAIRDASAAAIGSSGEGTDGAQAMAPPPVAVSCDRLLDVLHLYAQFEVQHGGLEDPVAAARKVYRVSADALRRRFSREAAKPVVLAWREFEAVHGDASSLRDVEGLLDAPAKQRRRLFDMAAQRGGKSTL